MSSITDVAYTYDPDANPDGLYLEGVPLRDLTFEDLDRLSEPLRTALAAQPFYTLVAAPPAEPTAEPTTRRRRAEPEIPAADPAATPSA